MFRRFVVILLAFIVLTAAGSYWVLSSKKFLQWAVKTVMEKNFSEWQIQEFDYIRKDFQPFHHIVFESITLVVDGEKQNFECTASSVTIELVSSWRIRPLQFKLFLNGVNIKSTDMILRDLNFHSWLTIDERRLQDIQGHWSLSSLDYQRYHLSSLAGELYGNQKQIRLDDFTAEGYDGEIAGEVLLEDFPTLSYRLTGQFKGVNIQQMQKINTYVFSQLQGEVDGTFTIGGNARRVDHFNIEFDIPRDGEIKASWLQLISSYVPFGFTFSKDLELLIKQDKYLPLKTFTTHIKNLNEKKLLAEIDLRSPKFNLAIENSTIEINLDEPFGSLIEGLKFLSDWGKRGKL